MRVADQAATGSPSAPDATVCRRRSRRSTAGSPAGAARNLEDVEQLVVPAAGRKVEQLRARRVGGVAGVHAPPVRFQSTQLSTVPAHSSPAAARARPSGIASSSQRILRCREQRIDRQSGLRLDAAPAGRGAAASSQNADVRRHCQTMHGPSGRPVARSQTMTDSRWLVTATASGLQRDPRPGRRRSRPRRCARARAGSCSTQPGCGNAIATGRDARATTAPASSNSSTLVLVVPWSMARMCGRAISVTPARASRGRIANAGGVEAEVVEQERRRAGGRKDARDAEHAHPRRV